MCEQAETKPPAPAIMLQRQQRALWSFDLAFISPIVRIVGKGVQHRSCGSIERPHSVVRSVTTFNGMRPAGLANGQRRIVLHLGTKNIEYNIYDISSCVCVCEHRYVPIGWHENSTPLHVWMYIFVHTHI